MFYKKKLKITKHGKLFEELGYESEMLICPECGSDVVHTGHFEKTFYGLFDITQTKFEILHSSCDICGCKWEVKGKKIEKNIDFGMIFAILTIISLCLMIIFVVLAICTDENGAISGVFGTLAIVSLLCFVIFGVFVGIST